MDVTVSKVARGITLSALAVHKPLAQTTLANAKRLHISEAGPLEALGSNDFLDALVRKIPESQDFTVVDVTRTAAVHWRAALGLWAKLALMRDEQCQFLTLATNTVKQEKEAQGLLDQLQEQLGLELIPIEELVKSGNLEKPKKDKEKDKDEEAEGDPDEGTPAADDGGPSMDPTGDMSSGEDAARGFARLQLTRGEMRQGSPKPQKPPKTAGKSTRSFVHRKRGR